jgi:hypothetical protein
MRLLSPLIRSANPNLPHARQVDQPHSLSHIFTLPRSVLSASPSGLIQILDPRQNYRQTSVLAAPSAQSGGLTGIDVAGDLVASWGWNVLYVTHSAVLTLVSFADSWLTVTEQARTTDPELHRDYV